MSDTNSESSSFAELIGPVEAVETDDTLLLKQQRIDTPGQLNKRKQAAADANALERLSTGEVKRVDPLAWLEFKRPGIQDGVYRNLRLGKYRIDARLDLHGLSVKEARTSLLNFVADCVSNDVRCALLNHGKGIGRETPAILKSYIANWLPQLEEILAFHSAQKHHGGLGATYLLVRKSARKRQQNFEEHSKRNR